MKRTVLYNITYGLQIRKNSGNYRKMAYEALSIVGLSGKEYAGRKWFELSGGEAQRVSLAARLILKPRVLLLDEPTASVDENSSRLIREASLRARERWGTTLIIASHDLDWLYGICDDIIYLFQGQISGKGRNNAVFGPFQIGADGFWEKKLGKEQRFVVPKPPPEKSVAVISSECINVNSVDEANPVTVGTLRGILTHLSIENKKGKLIASIFIEGFKFTANLSPEKLHNPKLYPGKEVILTYDPKDIEWH